MNQITTVSLTQSLTETLNLHEIDRLCLLINQNETSSTINNYINKCVENGYYHLPEEIDDLDIEATITTSTGKGYQDTITALSDSDITLNITGDYYRFKDPEIVEKLKNTADGVGLTTANITTITSLGTAFTNSQLKDFSEFSQFTGVTSIGTGTFDNTPLQLIIFPNTITQLNSGSFTNCTNKPIIVITTTSITGSNNNVISLTGSGNLGSTVEAIYVPDNLLPAYKNSWNTYKDHYLEPASDRLLDQLLWDNGDRIRFDNDLTLLI